MYWTTTCPSPLGELTLAGDGKKLCGLWLPEQKYFGGSILGEAKRDPAQPPFAAAIGWLEEYFAGKRPDPARLPLGPVGSSFRQVVWGLLLDIPSGEVVTYRELARRTAKKLGRPTMSGQAVGGAVAHNPISIIIPCHRVVGSGGSLTGYAGGIGAKQKLLALEGVDLTPFTLPDGRPAKEECGHGV